MNDMTSIEYLEIHGLPTVLATMSNGEVKRVFGDNATSLLPLITTFNTSNNELERKNSALLIEAKLLS